MKKIIQFNNSFLLFPSRKTEACNWRRYSISPSRFYSLIGENEYTSREEELQYMTKEKIKHMTKNDFDNIERGKKDEKILIKYYIEMTGVNIVTFTDELFVLKSDTFIRGIPDGLIVQNDTSLDDLNQEKVIGMIECKSKNSYSGVIPRRDYVQILGYLKLFDLEWCDYIVRDCLRDEISIERIYFSQDDWNEVYQKLSDFKNNLLIPKLQYEEYKRKFVNFNVV
jgi:hypothetical protein